MKTTGSRASAVSQTRGFGDLLYDKAGARPSLDLDFAGTSSLRDKITGEYLVDHTRASTGTYIDNEGLVKPAVKNSILQSENFTSGWITGQGTTTLSSVLSPIGTQSVYHYVPNTTNSNAHFVYRDLTNFSGVISLHVKSAGLSHISLIAQHTNNNTLAAGASFNLTNGTIHTSDNTTGAQIINLGDGWYRISITTNNSQYYVIQPHNGQTPNTAYRFRVTYASNGTDGVYIWGAQYEDGATELGEYIKTTSTINSAPRFTHERVETGNLISHSETLGPGGAWNQTQLDVRQSYAIKSPSGEFDGTLIKSNTANSFHNISRNSLTVKSGKDYTVSAHFKVASGTNFGCIRFFDGVNYVARASFTLTGSGSVSVNNGFNGEITALADGWYRCSITGTSTQNSSTAFISLDINSIFVHNGLGHSLYVWGAQFEQASAASTYVPSIDTFTSRLSNATYVDSAGLVKTSAFNEFETSETFTNWTAPFGTYYQSLTVDTTNPTLAPNGTLTATRLKVRDSLTNNHIIYKNIAAPLNSYFSVHAKAHGLNFIKLLLQTSSNNNACYVNFDLANGTVHDEKDAVGEIISLGNGWYRCILKNNTLVGGRVVFEPNTGATDGLSILGRETYTTGNNEDGIEVWGWQLSNAESDYVQTTGTPSGGARYSHDPETLTPTGLYLEPAATNFVPYSEDLSGTGWHNAGSGGSLTRTYDTNIVNPSGGTGASKIEIIRPDLGQWRGVRADQFSITGVDRNTASAWIKAATPSDVGKIVSIWQYDAGNYTFKQNIPLTNNWVRFSFTSAVDTGFAAAEPLNFGTLRNSTTADNGVINTETSVNFYVWGAQVEAGIYTSSYIPTSGSAVTRAADVYTSTANLTETFEPRGLLIEEERTTVATYSNIVGKYADWTKTALTIQTPSSPNYTSPMGTTGDLREMVENTQTGNRFQYHASVLLGTAAKCLTVFVRPLSTDRNIQLRVVAIGGNAPWINFDLNAGIVVAQNSASGTSLGNIAWSMGPPFIEKHPNGWYRIGFTNLAVASTTYNFGLYIIRKTNLNSSANGDGDSFTGDGQVKFSCWGVQYENGTFPTSYIHNETGSSLTRAADITSISGDNFGTYRTNLIDSKYPDTSNTSNNRFFLQHNAALGPFNKFDATKLTKDSGNSYMRYSSSGSITAQDTYTYTGYWKINSPDLKYLHIRHQDNKGKGFNLEDLSTFTGVYELGNLSTPEAFSITDVGNGWRKITLTCTGSRSRFWIYLSRTSTGVNNSSSIPVNGTSILVAHEQVEASSTPTNVIENLPTFNSRLGNATYVDSNGLIKTNYKNNVTHSENFATGGWSRIDGTITADNITAPNGTLTADKYVANTTSSASHIIYKSFSSGIQGALSIYAKFNGLTHLSLSSQLSASSQAFGVFNLTNGTVSSTHQATAKIVDVGNGWYRCIVYPQITGSQFFVIHPHNGGTPDTNFYGRVTYAGNGSDGIYLWGAQFTDNINDEGDYVKTEATATGGPRYSHDPETLVPTGLYLEPAATNLITRSNTTENKTPVGGSFSTSSETAPDGSITALTFTEDTSNGNHRYFEAVNTPPAGTYTFSIFVKAANRDHVYLRFDYSGQFKGVTFDLTQEEQEEQNLPADFLSASITKYPNGWYRLSATRTTNGSTLYAALEVRTGETGVGQNFIGNGLPAFHQWGSQVELGSHPTSYIYTSGSAVTRAADTYTLATKAVLDRDGGNKEAFYNQSGSRSVFADYKKSPTQSSRVFAVKPSGNSDSFLQYNDNTSNESKLRFKSQTGDHTIVVDLDKLLNKTAYGFDDNNSGSASNGVIGQTNTSLTLPTITDNLRPFYMRIGMHMNQNSGFLNSPISRLTFWKTRLPNSSLINITQQ